MPTLAVNNFNIVCASLGGFITLFGLVSYLLKEKYYLSEALISLIAGVVFSPHATNWIKPEEYALNDVETLDTITLYFIILNEKEKVAVALVGSKSFVKQKRYLLSFAVKPRREFSRTSEEADIAVSRV